MWMILQSFRRGSRHLLLLMKSFQLPRRLHSPRRLWSHSVPLRLLNLKRGPLDSETMARTPRRRLAFPSSTSINIHSRWRVCGKSGLSVLAVLTWWLALGTISSFGQAVSIESMLDVNDEVAKVGDVPNNAVRMNCVVGCGGSTLPPNAAQETGGNLDIIASRTPALVYSAQPVYVFQDQLPVLPARTDFRNNLTFIAALNRYCRRIFCSPNGKGIR